MKTFTVKTDGKGLWSHKVTDVSIIDIEWDIGREEDEEPEYMVKVYFDPKTWSPERDGLIYTDEGFRKELCKKLVTMSCSGELPKLPWDKIDYTEQGMQGDDYVHMILGGW